MKVTNEIFQMMQTASASTSRQMPKTDAREQAASASRSEFDRMLHARPKKPEPAIEKTADVGSAVSKLDETRDDVLQEIAAAMTVMANTATLPQIQTQEPLPTQLLQTTDNVLMSQEIQQPLTQSAWKESLTENTAPVIDSTKEQNPFSRQVAAMSERANTASLAQMQESKPSAKDQTSQETNGTTRVMQAKTTENAAQPDAEWKRDSGKSEMTQVQHGEAATAQPLFRNVKETPVKVGEPPVLDTNSKNLETQLAKQIGVGLKNGAQQVKIQLTPENLGTVTIELTRMQDGAMEVVLHTTTEKAANLLSQHTNALGVILQNNTQGTVQVEVQRQEQDQQFQQNQQHQEQNPQRQNQRQQGSEDFLQQLRLGLISSDEQAG